MDSDSIITILILVIFVMLSAFFSATETAFSSLNRIRIKNMADSGNRRAKTVYALSDNFDTLLSTILVGNNIVNIGAASLATVLFVKYFGNIGATLSTVVLTVVILIFGEISPKSLAKESPESFAMAVAPIIKTLIYVFTPINFIFSLWKKLLSKLLKPSGGSAITEEELLTIVDEAAQDGDIDEQESLLIRSAIEFNDLEAVDIFTPRVDVDAIDVTDDNEEIAYTFSETGYSRLPVYDGSIDNIIGILHHKDFYNQVYRSDKTVEQVMKQPLFITGSMKISDLLKQLQNEKSHMAIIADEYGGTMGIVTLEDILEELVGEIWDEHDDIVKDIEKTDEDCYKVMCSMDFEDMADFFDIDYDDETSTVGGWVMKQLGKVPSDGDMFNYKNLKILVSKTEDRRVVEIIVKVDADRQDAPESDT